MAKKSQAESQAVARRPNPGVSKAKYEAALDSLRRARASAGAGLKRMAEAERIGTVVGAAAGYGVGLAEQKGMALPTVMGLEPTALYGAALVGLSFVPSLRSSRIVKAGAEVGATLVGIAAYKLGTGKPLIVSGEESGWDLDEG